MTASGDVAMANGWLDMTLSKCNRADDGVGVPGSNGLT